MLWSGRAWVVQRGAENKKRRMEEASECPEPAGQACLGDVQPRAMGRFLFPAESESDGFLKRARGLRCNARRSSLSGRVCPSVCLSVCQGPAVTEGRQRPGYRDLVGLVLVLGLGPFGAFGLVPPSGARATGGHDVQWHRVVEAESLVSCVWVACATRAGRKMGTGTAGPQRTRNSREHACAEDGTMTMTLRRSG